MTWRYLLHSWPRALFAASVILFLIALTSMLDLFGRSNSEPSPAQRHSYCNKVVVVRPSSPLFSPNSSKQLPTVFVVTPTYPRALQIPELTRLSQTLMHAPHVFWVVAEDADHKTPAVSDLLARTGLSYVHILGGKPERYRNSQLKHVPRGVSNRLAGLEWIRRYAPSSSGVVYFADDDNTYDYRLFFEMAHTQRVSVFPVGLVTDFGLSTPVVRQGRVVGFYDGWVANREFPMDMAGFAVSVRLLRERPEATMPFKPGYEEDGFLKSLGVPKEEFELLADKCTKIMVWHTQTKKRGPFTRIDMDTYGDTNIAQLSPYIVQQ